jgi:RNA polymerase sporulation-specific sigma factor
MSRVEQERYLALASAGDSVARETLISRNMRLVAHKTKHLRGKVRDLDDVLSEGMIGLIKAVDHYDPGRQTPFANFACQCIENEIRMFLRRSQRHNNDISLELPLSGESGDRVVLDFMESGEDLAHDVMRRIEGAEAKELAARLQGIEKEIIELRYGLSGQPPLTQRQVAAIRGVSRPYISRVERRALRRLAHWLDQGVPAN